MMIKRRNGQSLIEVLVAVAVTIIVIAALAFLSTTGLRLSKITSRRAEATKLASSGVEAIRYVRDVCGFTSLAPGCYVITNSGTVCNVVNVDASCTGANYTLGGNSYSRKIQLSQYGAIPAASALEVETTVTWADSTGNGDVKDVISRIVLSAH